MRQALLLLGIAVCWTCAAQIPSHVPTDGLVAWYGLESDWNAGGNGVDAFSFNAKPGGFRHPSGLAVDWGDGGNFWSNTENGSELRFNAVFYSYSYIFRSSGDRNLGLSVRCVKD